MKHRMIKLLAMGVALLLAVGVGASVLKKRDQPADEPATVAVNANTSNLLTSSTQPSASESAAAITTAMQTSARTEDATTTAATAETTAATTAAAAAVTTTADRRPKNKAEIVSYFNNSANRVKTERPGYTWKDTVDIDRNAITCSNKLLDSAVPTIIGMFSGMAKFGQWTQQEPVAKGADHSEFPVSGKSWASKLDAAAVQSASCTEKAGVYTITIVLADEDVPTLPADATTLHTGKVMNAWTREELVDNAKAAEPLVVITNFQTNYKAPSVTCTIDKATGAMQRITYKMPAVFVIDVKQFGKAHATLPITRQAEYTIIN